MARILLIDDAQDFCLIFATMLKRLGFDCITSTSLEAGLQELEKNPFDLVFLDVYLGAHSGLDHIAGVMNSPGNPDVIIISASGSGKNAEEAIQLGSWDFLVKPVSFTDLEKCISRCLKHREAKSRFIAESTFHRGPIIGGSPQLLRAIQWVGIVARSKNNVLILGETGTGKELFARAVHENSERSSQSFTVVDCTNLPTTLAQSILFGHEKGTFTDAKERREGLFKQADGGTIFLDEIADLDMTIQKALLRVLQDHTFRPLSSRNEVKSDFRLVAATNRDLPQMVHDGTFRQDLYYRLKSCIINLPPLRERVDDIAPLAIHYMKKICKEQGIPKKRFSDDYLQALREYHWAGNVRELINTVNHSISNSFDAKTLHSYHLSRELRVCLVKNNVENADQKLTTDFIQPLSSLPDDHFSQEELPTFKEVRKKVVSQLEAEYLLELVNRTAGDIKAACKVAGLSRARLYELLQKHEIDYKHAS
ncbi:sigma-54-dependent transcriptional regulator [Pseudodesulfovibrio piezophilus]|uniref:Putative two component, sigma54 specific, transcriptional regulator, Fis family n=1 Tax=Pseudodesulfovibrio piezophilus (strain DSM 21447 / JCM 15486 / C1TLV30) TaxID=1322246 RepID=M1WSD0_PSEP2|nr:sigma-54 dependent transcriptional regulator [Pseudodesulfovibrio piezophilus]CCH50114.1 putative two component, sigma54 specific, transcriptional regulator, Fis family [Pseudodesulfovibrio piezophilus C1TLV30]